MVVFINNPEHSAHLMMTLTYIFFSEFFSEGLNIKSTNKTTYKNGSSYWY